MTTHIISFLAGAILPLCALAGYIIVYTEKHRAEIDLLDTEIGVLRMRNRELNRHLHGHLPLKK